MNEFIRKVKRVLKKPPKFIVERILYEIKAEIGRFWEPLYPRFVTQAYFLKKFKSFSIDELWSELGKKPYAIDCTFVSQEVYEAKTSDSKARILKKAAEVIEHKVNLLGSGLISLGETIEWSKDYKTSFAWPKKYFRSISYSDLENPTDVKFPWEVSRMQWMIPLGQAYLLTQDEIYAQKTKELIESWLEENPYAFSVNWACTMDVALRLIVWTWFFHVFKDSQSWKDQEFRAEFLKSLYLHGTFTSRHLEKSDVNGNHYTADAAGLVFAGLFFGEKAWENLGWDILKEEIELQVFEDGVDFEASIPYHRLVQELFFFPALYRIKQNLDIPAQYASRLKKMAYFTACYSRLDGSCPFWGDGDDARVLPFGDQDLNDHRYIIGLVGTTFSSQKLMDMWSGSNTELFWIFRETPEPRELPLSLLGSERFSEGGFYILRDKKNHVFIDCGPLGLKGRGGHGHNDLLSFEAVLNHTRLIVDPGSYVYTADYRARNAFRSTPSHNTPQIDGEEINRFIRHDYLWNLHNDAKHEVEGWEVSPESSFFKGSHTGYNKLKDPVKPMRMIHLDHQKDELTIEDIFEGKGSNQISIPFHLHPLIRVESGEGYFLLKGTKDIFKMSWESSSPWTVDLEPTLISPSYGVVEKSQKLVFKYEGQARVGLKVIIRKESSNKMVEG
jgi:hypothetical protein